MKDKDLLDFIYQATDISFSNEEEPLLRQAFTHPSARKKNHYERLEFLGDRVLAMVVAHWLFEARPKDREGALTIALTNMVSKSRLLAIAKKLEFNKILISGDGKNGLSKNGMDTAMTNAVESFLAVLFLTKDNKLIESFVKKHWQEFYINSNNQSNNPRGQLQEWLQRKKLPPPIYHLKNTSGNDHAPVFTITLDAHIKKIGIVTEKASTKKMAMIGAAAKVMTKIKQLKL
ncbi:MAG: ribonuclease III [Alphaproteobacteria bacterium]